MKHYHFIWYLKEQKIRNDTYKLAFEIFNIF